MCDLLNTHTYDGKLSPLLLPELYDMTDKTTEEKTLVCRNIMNKCSHFDGVAKKHLENIVSSIGTAANLDNTNQLVAEDLLYLCCYHSDNEEFLDVLEKQLMDMETGACPQGRCARLYQTLLAFN